MRHDRAESRSTITNATGGTRLTTPLPNSPGLVGVRFVEQWVVQGPTTCRPLASGLSNALQVQIQ